MTGVLTIITRVGGSWKTTSNGHEIYTGGTTIPCCVDSSISYEHFVEMLYEMYGINPAEFRIEMKAMFMENIPAAVINNEISFRAFINANNPTYIASLKSYCPLFVTTELVGGAEDVRPNTVQPCTRTEAPAAVFRSSSGSNTLRDTIPVVTRQVQYGYGVYANTPEARQQYSPPIQVEEPQNVGYYGHQQQDAEHEQHQEQEYNDIERDYCDNVFNNEDRIDTEDIDALHVHRSSPITQPSSSNQFIRSLPPIPPSTTMSNDASSSTRVGDVCVGQIFKSKQELRDKLCMMAMKNHFEIKVSKSSMDRFEVKCRGNGCQWRLRATKPRNDAYFRVTKMNSVHSCQNDHLEDSHRQATTRVIGQLIKDKFTDANRIYTPRNIRDDIQREYGVCLSYSKTWRSKEEALRLVTGDPILSYKALPLYCHVLEDKNPGTITTFQRDDDEHFLYFFMAIGACIRGFRENIRPVIAVDGTFLKGKYRGSLFIAAALDGNDQIFPLAFGIADSENDDSWEWFFHKLRDAISPIEGLVFISDRHNSIEKGIHLVFPDAFHGFCIYHISGNIKAKYKMRARKTDTFLQTYFQAAKVYRVSEFDEYMASLRNMHPEAANYLENDVGLHRWARSQFPARRYDMMTTNIAESMNSLLRNARALPIVALIEYIRSVLQRWFFDRREISVSREEQLTEAVQIKIDDQLELSRTMVVNPISRWQYEVKERGKVDIIDLQLKTCSCRLFDLQQLPCAHALAVCRHVRLSYIPLCSNFYTTEALVAAYAEPIQPVGDEIDWVVPSELREINIKPPKQRATGGRPRKQRIPSVGEDVVRRMCSRCHGIGHNRSTCKNPIPLNSME